MDAKESNERTRSATNGSLFALRLICRMALRQRCARTTSNNEHGRIEQRC